MATGKTQSTGEVQVSGVEENVGRGWLMAQLAIPAGIVLWVAIWSLGFMASFVSFAIAWLAVYLYSVGAKAPISRRSAPLVIITIVLGIVLSFLAGMAVDGAVFFVDGTDQSQWSVLATGEYWDFFLGNLFGNADIWSSYAVDIVVALAFGVLGCYGIIQELLKTNKPATAVDTKN